MILKKLALTSGMLYASLFGCQFFENNAWEEAYQVTKENYYEKTADASYQLYKSWPNDTLHDSIFKELYGAYLFYKSGHYHEAHQVFPVIDEMIKMHIESKFSKASSFPPGELIRECP